MAETILVKVKEEYPIHIGRGLLGSLGERLEAMGLPKKARIVTNPTVRKLYGPALERGLEGRGFEVAVLPVPDGEEYKSLGVAHDLYVKLTELGALRNEVLIGFGGGVIGDLAGFVAATYMRGVPYVQVPTTLLAQVDSSVGGKVAVNLPAGKNLVGAFHQPKMVLIDVEMLKTLPPREFKSGLAEVIKAGFLAGEEFLRYVEDNLEAILKLEPDVLIKTTKEACSFKARVVEEDERDLTGRRACLNYGHTVGHAIETLTEYVRVSHGEAVAVGLVSAALISRRLGLVDEALVRRHVKVLREASFSVKLPSDVTAEAVLKSIQLDKKRSGEGYLFVLLKGVGQPILQEVEQEVIAEVLEELKTYG